MTKFGAFVDIGVHQDGRIHISQRADRFVRFRCSLSSCIFLSFIFLPIDL